ncbi:MAG: DUF494 domain-containing protein [Thioalkalivibrionaceae bacterium]
MTQVSVLDVLLYLFENLLDEDPQPERDELEARLVAADFPAPEIEGALDWLDRLISEAPCDEGENRKPFAMRVYTPEEQARIDLEARGFLLFLEQNGLLTLGTRELVIDRALELDGDEIDLEQIKWVVLMVLFNQPDERIEYARLEAFVMNDHIPGDHDVLH